MSHILTIDLVNLEANENNYKVISFPRRVKILEMSFSVNGAAMGGDANLDRIYRLYAWGAHPTGTVETPWTEWSFPVFGFSDANKPVVNAEVRQFASTSSTPYTIFPTLPQGGGILNIELNHGVFAPGDHMAVWVQPDAGDWTDIVWADTEATINIVYEETSLRTPYEQSQTYPWL